MARNEKYLITSPNKGRGGFYSPRVISTTGDSIGDTRTYQTNGAEIYHHIQCYPISPVLELTSSQRIAGRFARATVQTFPSTDGEIDLCGDAFFSLFLDEPIMQNEDDIPVSRMLNQRLVQWVMSKPAYDKGRIYTVGNYLASEKAAGALWESLMTDEALKEALELQKMIERLMNSAWEHRMASDALSNANEKASKEHAKQADEDEREAQKLASKLRQTMDELEDDPMMGAAVSSKIKKAGEEGQEIAEAMSSWGIDPGEWKRNSLTDALRVKDLLEQKIQQIAKIAGRSKGLALSNCDTLVPMGSEIVGVEYTRNLMNIFPTERAKLIPAAPKALRRMALMEYADRGLIGNKIRGKARNDGPFVALIDCSGSMEAGSGEYTREVYAKGLALGIAQAAREMGHARDYMLISFSASKTALRSITSRDNWTKHIEWASLYAGGGTDFEVPMKQAMREVENWEETFGQRVGTVDVMMLTDGEARVGSSFVYKWREFAKRNKTRFILIKIAKGEGSIDTLANRIITLDEITSQSTDELAIELGEWILYE